MYYILKERRIIKRFAVTAEEMIIEWDHVNGLNGEISIKTASI
jgi:hypothetical protein